MWTLTGGEEARKERGEGGQWAVSGGRQPRFGSPAPPGGALTGSGPASPRPSQGRGGAGAGLERGGAWAAVPPRPEECGLWLVPCPHSGQRRNVNRVFTARPERTCSVPSRQRTPGSGSRSDALSATPQSPQHLWVDGREVRAVRSEGTQGQHPGRGALRTKCSLEKEGTQK